MKFKLTLNKGWKDKLLTFSIFFTPVVLIILFFWYFMWTASRKNLRLYSVDIEMSQDMKAYVASYDIISDSIVNFNMIESPFPQIKDVFIEYAWGYADYSSNKKKIFSKTDYSIILSFHEFRDWSRFEKDKVKIYGNYALTGYPPTFYLKEYITEIPDTLHFTIKCNRFEEHIICKKKASN